MKRRFLLLMMTALLSVGAWAAEDLTLNASDAKGFTDWGGFTPVSETAFTVQNWATGGWEFETALSQDDYCGVEFAFEATSVKRVTFTITFEGGEEQAIDVPSGSTGFSADFAYSGGIKKLVFSYGDWDDGVPGDVTFNFTKAVVKANSTGEFVELPFADLSDSATNPETGDVVYTKDADNQTITLNNYTWACYWSFDPAILSDDYEKIVVTFAEAVPVSGLTINAEVTDDASWCGTAIGNLTKGATKATAYFSALPGASFTRVGFFLDWQAETATLKIASAKLYKKTEFVRTITDALYATTSFPAAVDFSQTDGIKAYIAKANDAKTKVELTEVTKVAAGVPVILNGSAKDYTLHYTTESTDDVSDNNLLVSDGTVTGDENTIYVLANGTSGVGFYLLKSGDKVPASKAYLIVTGSSESRSFIDIDDNVTGIQQVKGSKSQVESYYNLNGQRVVQPTKGVYIVNGKKIIIK